MRLSANTAWFTLNLNGRTDFQVYSFTGRESVSRPYMFTLELVNASAAEDLTGFIGGPALLTVYDRSGAPRLVHGLVSEMRRLHRGNHLTHYQCVIVPRLWFLGLTRDHRIFQHESVTGIITRILEEQGFAAETFAFKCFHAYPPREYCVQYGESDLHFISRLCEEEGIYFYFEHAADKHCLCFSDMAGGPDIPGEADLRYHPGSGQPADTAVISRVTLHSQSVSDKATYRDWNFLTPSDILESSENEPDFAKAPLAPGMDYDIYRYPFLYQTQAEGDRYARLQLLRQLAWQIRIEAASDASRFLPGFSFIIHGHDVDAVNAGWWVTAVSHYGEQPQVLGREAPDRELRYTAEVTAIPEKTRFVPALDHAKSRVMGDQTAIVTGPEGEEIYPDAYGRVKVQFFWDREGQWDENTTCWIRVSQGWAGTEFGAMAIPRIGHEVIVSFLEGDPDRPIITGRMHHAETMPPYVLPEHKTRTVFKSMSTPGGDGPRGFNELSVEDKAGEEEIYLHGEKDVNGHVKHVWKEHILHDKHRTVDRHTYARTKGETHETLQKNRKTEQHADDSLTVHGSSHTKVDHKWLRKVGADVHLYAGDKAVFEAGSQATLKGGSAWMQFEAAGVFAGGSTIRLGGGGSAGSRKGATPLLPVKALVREQGTEVEAKRVVMRKEVQLLPATPIVDNDTEVEAILQKPEPKVDCGYLYNPDEETLDLEADFFKKYESAVLTKDMREEDYLFPGGESKEKAVRWTQTVRGHDIDVVFGTDFGAGKEMNGKIIEKYGAKVMSSLSALPELLAKAVKKVEVSPFEYPEEWNRNQNSNVYGITIKNKITIFPYALSDSLPSTIVHEASHALENQIITKDKDFPQKWTHAVFKDNRFPNKYSKTNNNEDFSESVVAYLASKDTPCEDVFKELFPSRYVMLNAIFAR